MKMKIVSSFLQTILTMVLTLTLLGCGGGGGGGGGTGPNQGGSGGGTGSGGGASGGSGGTGSVYVGGLLPGGVSLSVDPTTTDGFVVGVTEGGSGAPVIGIVDRFGSIVIDGRVIDTDSAFIYVEGESASQSDLRQGQSIVVMTDSTGTSANGVFYRANVKGPATTVTIVDEATAEAELTILGQVVRTNATTTFNGVDIGNLTVNDLYEVSGFVNDAGEIEASYIESKTSLAEYKVMGTVANLSSTTFTLQGLNIDYSSATMQDFDQGIADGDIVEVRGAAGDFTAPDQLVANEVELLTVLRVGDATPLEVEGFVDRFVSATQFDVITVPVTTNGSTTYVNGSVDSIALGVKLIVRGSVQADGVLLAESITIQPTNAVRAEGSLEAIDLDAATVTVLGITFTTRDLLRLEDKSGVGIDPMTLGDLTLGDELEVRGYLDGTEVVASRIERDDPRDRARLRGPVSSEDASAGSVTVLGVVLTGQAGITEYQDVNDNVITAEQFHNLIEVGSFVKGDWDVFVDTTQTVDELSIED